MSLAKESMDPYRGHVRFAGDHAEELEALRSVFEEWHWVIAEYSRRVEFGPGEPDAAYWYLERTLIGSLAAAAWRCGVPALEEFDDEKAVEHDPPRKGRRDLWLGLRGARGIGIEAKRCYTTVSTAVAVTDGSVLVDSSSIQDAVQCAVGDCQKFKEWYPRTLGIAFVMPRLKFLDRGPLSAALEELQRSEFNGRGPDVWAWSPGSHDPHRIPKFEGDYFPGVAVIGFTCRWDRT